MERETKTITTPKGKHKIILKTWLTGGERREIINLYVENRDEGEKVKNVPINKIQDKIIEMNIVSVNDKKENFVEDVVNMHESDYYFILGQIDEVRIEEDKKKEK